MSSLQRSLFKHQIPHIDPHKIHNFKPLSWDEYFVEKKYIEIEDNKYCVYTIGSKGPVLFLIHGGGFSGLSWALFAHEIIKIIDCKCIAMDLRGHGETRTSDDDDLSIEKLTKDVIEVINQMFSSESNINLIIVGHSMGGAVAVHVANAELGLKVPLSAIILVDVVEGTAIESLNNMQSFLRARPKYFDSITKAIEWSVKTGQIKNVDSARVSVPGQLEKIENPGPEYFNGPRHNSQEFKITPRYSSIPENAEASDSELPNIPNKPPLPTSKNPISTEPKTANQPSQDVGRPKTIYVWRAHLEKTEPYWEGWFKGLSAAFVQTPIPKLIILAGVDHLDKVLTIGQMQGKFQMAILAKCGHSVQEDLPDEVAEIISAFLSKHKLATFLNPHYVPTLGMNTNFCVINFALTLNHDGKPFLVTNNCLTNSSWVKTLE